MTELYPHSEHDALTGVTQPFDQPPLPLRELQVATVIRHATIIKANWPPPTNDENKPPWIEDVVAESEATNDSDDLKNARLIGMAAVIHEAYVASDLRMRNWRVAPHLGMLNALGATISAGLIVSEDALHLASDFQQDYSEVPVFSLEHPYMSPGPGPVIQGMKHLISTYSTLAFRTEGGAEGLIAYYADPLDTQIRVLPPGPAVLSSYTQGADTPPNLRFYLGILDEVLKTRSAVVESEPEIESWLMQARGKYNLWKRQQKQSA
jgi:hypothetical protein